MTAYTYKLTDRQEGLYTVGFYDPSGKWEPESDHTRASEAADRVHWLNGGQLLSPATKALIAELESRFPFLRESIEAQESITRTAWEMRAIFTIDELNKWARGLRGAA